MTGNNKGKNGPEGAFDIWTSERLQKARAETFNWFKEKL